MHYATRRTTHYGMKGEIRPGLYAFSEIHMLDENGVNYLSRTWEEAARHPVYEGASNCRIQEAMGTERAQ